MSFRSVSWVLQFCSSLYFFSSSSSFSIVFILSSMLFHNQFSRCPFHALHNRFVFKLFAFMHLLRWKFISLVFPFIWGCWQSAFKWLLTVPFSLLVISFYAKYSHRKEKRYEQKKTIAIIYRQISKIWRKYLHNRRNKLAIQWWWVLFLTSNQRSNCEHFCIFLCFAFFIFWNIFQLHSLVFNSFCPNLKKKSLINLSFIR